MNFQDRVTRITGGSSGMGRAAAIACTKSGEAAPNKSPQQGVGSVLTQPLT